MTWKTIAVALSAVFAVVLLQTVIAGPFIQVIDSLQDSGDYGDDNGPADFDGESRMEEMQDAWFNVGLIAIFGTLAWATARVVRRELTRQRGGGL